MVRPRPGPGLDTDPGLDNPGLDRWAAWNLADKDETTSILVEDADVNGNWTDADFKGHGPFVLANMPQ